MQCNEGLAPHTTHGGWQEAHRLTKEHIPLVDAGGMFVHSHCLYHPTGQRSYFQS